MNLDKPHHSYKMEYHNLINRLSKLPDRFHIDKLEGLKDNGAKTHTFCKNSKIIIKNFFDIWQEEKSNATMNQLLKEYINKMLKTVQSIALILHIIDGDGGTIINENYTKVAIKLSKYFYQNVKSLLEKEDIKFDILFETPQLLKFKDLMRKSINGLYSLNEYYSRRARIMRSPLSNKDDAFIILELLEDHNVIKIDRTNPSKICFSIIGED
jgi:hypothetical protein